MAPTPPVLVSSRSVPVRVALHLSCFGLWNKLPSIEDGADTSCRKQMSKGLAKTEAMYVDKELMFQDMSLKVAAGPGWVGKPDRSNMMLVTLKGCLHSQKKAPT